MGKVPDARAPILEEGERGDLRQVHHIVDLHPTRHRFEARVMIHAEISHGMSRGQQRAQRRKQDQSVSHLTDIRLAVRKWIYLEWIYLERI